MKISNFKLIKDNGDGVTLATVEVEKNFLLWKTIKTREVGRFGDSSGWIWMDTGEKCPLGVNNVFRVWRIRDRLEIKGKLDV